MQTASSDRADARADTIDQSGSSSRVPTMTERYFGFDWSTVMPWIIDDVRVEVGTADEVFAFLAARGTDLFAPPNQRFMNEPMTEAKKRYCAELDALLMRREGAIVGYFLGQPTDWSTYYCRSMSILPEIRNNRIGAEFCRRILSTIGERTDARRVEVDTSVGNPAMPRILMGLGFVPTMMVTSERWGLMTRFTRFIEAEARTAFSRQYVNAPDLGQEIQGEREK